MSAGLKEKTLNTASDPLPPVSVPRPGPTRVDSLKSNFLSLNILAHKKNPILLRFLPFSAACFALAFFTLAISLQYLLRHHPLRRFGIYAPGMNSVHADVQNVPATETPR
jgi:hypothetical protein